MTAHRYAPQTSFSFLSLSISIFVLFCNTLTHASSIDTTPPSVRITRPAQWAVINSNAIRLAAEARDTQSGVESVEFFIRHDNANRDGGTDVLVAADSAAPYETVWDCSGILDQGWLSLYAYCIAVDSAGNRARTSMRHMVLDRRVAHSALTAEIPYTSRAPRVDGVLDSSVYHPQPSVRLTNDDNSYAVYGCWDKRFLYWYFMVNDSVVQTRFARTSATHEPWDSVPVRRSESLPALWQDDCVALMFDPFMGRTELIHPDNRTLYVAPSGRVLARQIFAQRGMLKNWGDGVRCSTRITRLPARRGYAVELAIAWESLGVVPRDGLRIGTDFYFVDRDFESGPRVIASWSSQPHNHLNPSEWGTLVLRRTRAFAWILVLILLVPGAAITLLVIYTRRKKLPAPVGANPPVPQTQQELSGPMAEVAQYLREHYADTGLDRDTIAHALKLNAGYVSRNFSAATGQSLSAYLSSIRLEHAQSMLLDRRKNVTEVALACGFGSVDHFIRQFKHRYGVTPKQYQQNASTSHSPQSPGETRSSSAHD